MVNLTSNHWVAGRRRAARTVDGEQTPSAPQPGPDQTTKAAGVPPSTPAEPATVRVELVAAKPEDDAAKPVPSDTGSTRADFAAYSAQTQAAAKWFIAALAAVGTVLFGAGPLISRPNLDWDSDRNQLIAAWLLGIVGVLGIAVLIGCATYFLLPSAVTLWHMPPSLESDSMAQPKQYFPSEQIRSLKEFQEALHDARAKQRAFQCRLRTLNYEIPIEEAGSKSGQTSERLEKLTEERSQLLTVSVPDAKEDLAILEDTRLTLLERGRHAALRDRLTALWGFAIGGAVTAAIGAIGFQLALSAPTEDAGDTAAASSATPQVTTMTLVPGEGGQALWAALSLRQCETSPGVVPVLFTSGTGTSVDPFVVQTLPGPPGCVVRQFTVFSDIAVVDVRKPDQVTITYTPAPQPTNS